MAFPANGHETLKMRIAKVRCVILIAKTFFGIPVATLDRFLKNTQHCGFVFAKRRRCYPPFVDMPSLFGKAIRMFSHQIKGGLLVLFAYELEKLDGEITKNLNRHLDYFFRFC